MGRTRAGSVPFVYEVGDNARRRSRINASATPPTPLPPGIEPKPKPATFLSLQFNPWRADFIYAAAAVVALSYCGAVIPTLENLAPFRVQYAVYFLIAALVYLRGRKPRAAALCGAVALLNIGPQLALYAGGDRSTGAPELRVMSVNVLAENEDYSQVLEMIRKQQPDMVFFMEVNYTWDEQLQSLADILPHNKRAARPDTSGVALYSKRPLEDAAVIEYDDHVPSIVARIIVGSRPLTIIGTHPMPPILPRYQQRRNTQFDAIADQVRRTEGASMVLGDFNLTSDTPTFRRLLKRSGLRDSRQGFGIQPSWHAGLPPLMIPIDHCLVSEEILVHDRRTGPRVGSDHLPVTIDVSLQ